MGEGCDSITPQLSDYLDHLLTAPEMEAIEHHLADCPECFAHLAELRHVQTSLQNLPMFEPPEAFYQGVLAKVQSPEAEAESEGVRSKSPWLSMWSYKAAGTFAILALVLVATREKRKDYLRIRQSAEQWAPRTPAPVPPSLPASAPTELPKAIPPAAPKMASPKTVPSTGQLAARLKVPASAPNAAAKAFVPPIKRGQPQDSRRDTTESLYSSLQEQFLGKKSAAMNPVSSDTFGQTANKPVPVVASVPTPVSPPVATNNKIAPTRSVAAGSGAATAGGGLHKQLGAAPSAKPVSDEAPSVDKDESAAIEEKAVPEESAMTKTEDQETPSSESSDASAPVKKKAATLPVAKAFNDPQLKGQAPRGWTVHVIRSQPQLDKLIASLPDTETGDLKEIGTQFDSDMLLVLIPTNSNGPSPVIESQVPDTFADRVDLYYLEIPPSQNNPPILTCITVPKTQLPIIFKRVSLEP